MREAMLGFECIRDSRGIEIVIRPEMMSKTHRGNCDSNGISRRRWMTIGVRKVSLGGEIT